MHGSTERGCVHEAGLVKCVIGGLSQPFTQNPLSGDALLKQLRRIQSAQPKSHLEPFPVGTLQRMMSTELGTSMHVPAFISFVLANVLGKVLGSENFHTDTGMPRGKHATWQNVMTRHVHIGEPTYNYLN